MNITWKDYQTYWYSLQRYVLAMKHEFIPFKKKKHEFIVIYEPKKVNVTRKVMKVKWTHLLGDDAPVGLFSSQQTKFLHSQ